MRRDTAANNAAPSGQSERAIAQIIHEPDIAPLSVSTAHRLQRLGPLGLCRRPVRGRIDACYAMLGRQSKTVLSASLHQWSLVTRGIKPVACSEESCQFRSLEGYQGVREY